MIRRPPAWLLPATVLMALVLMLLPLPPALAPARPAWMALVVAYWVIETPERVGLGAAFVIGLIADLCVGGLLGEQALRMVVLAFILQRFRARLRFFPLWQQSAAIGAILLNDRVVASAVHVALGLGGPPPVAWLSPVIGMAAWPVLFLALDALRLRLRRA